jgi:glycosyltransferase involved in cell wall biosynthesis
VLSLIVCGGVDDMRIGLNLLHALPEIGGGWNYIARLVQALGDYDRKNEYAAFVTGVSAGLAPRQANFTLVPVRVQPGARWQRILYENTLLQGLAGRHQLDCLHWFANVHAIVNRVPSVVTIYDLQPFRELSQQPPLKRLFLRSMLRHTVRSSPRLLPMSQSTANDLERELGANPARLTVIPPILPDQFRPVNEDRVSAFRTQHRLPTNFWLYVAHFYPHKNHVRLLQSYQRLKELGVGPWPLVLRGDDHGSLAEAMAIVVQLGLQHDVVLLPTLAESEMPTLYSAAAALVFPSLYEGGGMPLMEAMACGCPVVASTIPPVKEFAGDVALLFDHTDIASMASLMRAFQHDPEMRIKRRTAGLDRARTYRAEHVVDLLLEAYAMAMATAKPPWRTKVK